jgi:glycosyltransferase involved in cell wall biosynthesis
MKVLHICNGAQGFSPFYKFLFKALQNRHVEQSVVVPVWKTPTIDFEDIRCEYFYRESGIIARLMFRRKIKKLTKFTVEKFKVETHQMIHAHTWFSDGAVAYKLFKKYGIPYIIAVRNTDINIFYKYFFHLRKLGHRILENASQIVFISPAHKNYFVNQLLPQKIKHKIEDKISVIPNGISTFWFSNAVQKTEVIAPAKLLSIGAITPNKNHLALCNAVELLRKRGVEIELTIVGKGYKDAPNYLKKLENYITGKSYIKILEKQNEEELLKTFRDHDIFVLPSHTETFGLVYIEALTQGLPVIYSKGQGIDGYFESGEIGYSVDSKNIEEIAEAIDHLTQHYSTFTKNVEKIDFSVFDWENIAERYLKIYQH